MNTRRLIPSPAMIVAVLALVMACAGTGYAAIVVTGKNVRDRSLTYKDLKRDTLGGSRVKEQALDARKLRTVPRAETLDGIDSSAFAQGAAKLSHGGATLALDTAPRHLDTPVGRFELDCLGGIQGAEVRYDNTTGAAARVWRTRVTGGAGSNTATEEIGPGGATWLVFEDPNYSIVRVSQGSQTSELRVHSVENGADCRFDWELVQAAL